MFAFEHFHSFKFGHAFKLCDLGQLSFIWTTKPYGLRGLKLNYLKPHGLKIHSLEIKNEDVCIRE